MAIVDLPVPGAPSTRFAEPSMRPPQIISSSPLMPKGTLFDLTSFIKKSFYSRKKMNDYRFLDMQTVFSFVKRQRAHRIKHFAGDFFAAMGGQTMGNKHIGRRLFQQCAVKLEPRKMFPAFFRFVFLAHA